ncbi:MAG TPA: GNAT family N-acetyltransferase [Thermoleophilaceae bacterium]
MIGPAPSVRRAERSDLDEVVRTLTRAFYDDPVMRWFFPDDGNRAALNERFFRLRIAGLLAQEEVYTTDDHSGAACWAQPGRWEMGPLEGLMFVMRVLPMTRLRTPLLARGWSAVDAAHPKEPHWYLAILGTEPESQGRGIGSALMQPVLDDCDRNEVPAYLESSKRSNLDFYARHGFRVTEELTLPEGPTIWPMWRDPRRV